MMGATKRMAELLVQDLASRTNGHSHHIRCTCVRFGNVAGSSGSVIPIFLKQIALGGPVTITNDEMTRYFMTIPEAVQLVLEAASIGTNGEICMLDMGEPVKITDLAKRLIRMSGLRPGMDIEIRITGSRPGEKLHEMLWSDASQVIPTSFPRVLSVQPTAPAPDFADHLRTLEQVALKHDDQLTRETLMRMPINFGVASSPVEKGQPWYLDDSVGDSDFDIDSGWQRGNGVKPGTTDSLL
jgi:FlaA1/EpsC-like NDP-sugar epimerase